MADEEGGNGARMSRETAKEVGKLTERIDGIKDRLREHIEASEKNVDKLHERISEKDRETAAAIKELTGKIEALTRELAEAIQPLRDEASRERGARGVRRFLRECLLVMGGAIGGGLIQGYANRMFH